MFASINTQHYLSVPCSTISHDSVLQHSVMKNTTCRLRKHGLEQIAKGAWQRRNSPTRNATRTPEIYWTLKSRPQISQSSNLAQVDIEFFGAYFKFRRMREALNLGRPLIIYSVSREELHNITTLAGLGQLHKVGWALGNESTELQARRKRLWERG